VAGVVDEQADAPPEDLLFRRRVQPLAVLKELWQARELARTLAERELRARYKQTFLGFAWAVITPVMLMIVFTLFFDKVANIDTGGAPYPLFSYVGLLPWTFFSSSVSSASQSLVSNMSLLNKVYCPREVFPMGSILVAGLDTVIATGVLGLLFAVTQYAPRITSVYVPILLAVQLCFTLGVALLAAIATVYIRDLRQSLPMFLQLGLFATPVAFGLEEIPASLRPLYAVLNPLGPVIDGYRDTVLLGQAPDWGLLGLGAASSLVLLLGGYTLFKRLETGIADVA
jgi:ABC-type polysaccharide/polyol phosphate export permease